MRRHIDNFPVLLEGIELETLENSFHPVYALSPGLEFIYFNIAWFHFAQENKGEPGISERYLIGSKLEDALSGPLKDFYSRKFLQLISDQQTWKHEYECSTAERFRLFAMDVYPLKNRRGLVVVNSLAVERRHNHKTSVLDQAFYKDMFGVINQCSNCRRTQLPARPSEWHWVPSLVEKMPAEVSHTICPPCFDYYWRT